MNIRINCQEKLNRSKKAFDARERAARLNKSRSYFAKIFKCKPQQVSQAFYAKQPGLLDKIIKHLDKLESKAA